QPGGALQIDAAALAPVAQLGLGQGLARDLDGEPPLALFRDGQAAARVANGGPQVDARRVPHGLDLIATVAVGLADAADAADVGDDAGEHESSGPFGPKKQSLISRIRLKSRLRRRQTRA